MPRKVDAAERRREVVDAVKRIVVADGLARVSLREVAGEADLVVGSVRHYFATSSDLLVCAFDDVVDSVLARVLDASPLGRSAGHPGEEGLVAQLCQLLPLDEERAVDLCVWSEFKLAARTRPELAPTAERGHRSLAAALGAAVRSLRPELPDEELVVEAERLLATVEGLGLHAMLQGRWLDVALCLAVVRAQVASLAAAVPRLSGASAGIH
ncbi:TetR/AcrR family transcriptional regulator [Sinomonas flava]|uniref:TetR/AcrR family transcriptional regulator n=1 Tax=Sinomonas flava TaxID=496857 RepID=UPI0039A54292